MGTLDMLRASARNGGPLGAQPMSDEEEHRRVAERDREDAERAAYAKEALERLANQVTNVAAKRAEIIREPLATDPQTRYVASLINQLTRSEIKEFSEIGWTANEWHAHLVGKFGGIPRRLASETIDRLKAHVGRMEAAMMVQPATPTREDAKVIDAPDGRYALVGEDGVTRFYRVAHSKKNGRAYVKIQASDDLHFVAWHAGGRAVVEAIAADPEAASVRYGREIGACGRCGRTLTDATSRANGIGPECAKKGWM